MLGPHTPMLNTESFIIRVSDENGSSAPKRLVLLANYMKAKTEILAH